MTVLLFPSNPTEGQIYDAPNGVQYVFDGVKWSIESVASTSAAVTNSVQDRVAPMFVDGNNQGITFTYDAETNTIGAIVTSTIGNTLVNGDYQAVLETDGKLSLPPNVINQEDPGNSVITGIRFGDDTIQTTAFNLNEYGDFYTGNFLASGAGLTNYGGSVFIRASRPDAESSLDFIFKENGQLELPAGGDIVDNNGNSVLGGGGIQTLIEYDAEVSNRVEVDGTSARIRLNTQLDQALQTKFEFNPDGSILYPGDITQSYQDVTTCLAGADTVIYTSTAQYQHALKLFVMVEGTPDGGAGPWETQACDIIAVKGFVDNIVHVTAYGVTYSGASAFATFDGRWNATTNRIEIVCRPVSLTNTVVASVHAIEMTSND